MRLPLRRVVKVALGILLALFLTNFLVSSFSSPLTEIERHLSSLDWEKEDVDSIAGGYSIGLLSASAHGSYRSRRADRPGEVHIEVERSVPFGNWVLTDYRYEKPSGE
jgi:hypothetical protein